MMGIWTRLFGSGETKPKNRRGKNRTAEEKLRQLEYQHLLDLKKRKSPKFEQLMDERLGLSEAGRDPLDELEKTAKRFNGMKKLFGQNDASDSFMGQAVQGLSMLVPMLTNGMANNLAGTPPNTQPELTQQSQQPPAQILAPAQDDFARNNETPKEKKLSFISSFAISQLQNKTPEQAAAWLLSLQQAEALAGQICQVSNEQLPMLLNRYAQEVEDLAGVVDWLLDLSRRRFLNEIADEIRRLAMQSAPNASGDVGL